MEIDVVTIKELNEMATKIIDAIASLLNSQAIYTRERLYSNKEACKYLKFCSKTLQNYRDNGQIKFTQVGRKISYSQQDLSAFLQEYKKDLFINEIKIRK